MTGLIKAEIYTEMRFIINFIFKKLWPSNYLLNFEINSMKSTFFIVTLSSL